MWLSLGYVIGTPGTPEKITQNAAVLYPNIPSWLVHSIFIQQVRTNNGFLLIGRQGVNEGTGLDLNCVLPVPTVNSLPWTTVGIGDAPNALNADDYYVDWTEADNKALVSVLIL